MSDATLPLYQYRVIEERDQLVDRLVKLGMFIEGPLWQHVTHDEQGRMLAQRIVMEQYAKILNDRIAHFGEGV
jgi:hypothetical protein